MIRAQASLSILLLGGSLLAAAEKVILTVAGSGGWTTTLQLYNPASFPSRVALVLRAPGREGSETDPSAALEIPPGEVLVVPQLLATLFPANGAGSLDVRLLAGNLPVLRTVVAKPGLGGVVVPALAFAEALAAPGTGAIVFPEAAAGHVNVGLRSLSAGATWELTLRDRRGTLRARRAGKLPRDGFLQESATDLLGESPRPGDVLLVSVTAGALFAYATPIAEGAASLLMAEKVEDGERFPLTWRQEAGLRIPNRTGREVLAPEVLRLPDGRLRMYFNVMTKGIASAVSTDGIVWEDEPGLRLASKRVSGALDFDVGHCWLVKRPDGGWRMLYGSNSGIDTPARMKSAISTDLLTFLDEGLVFDVGPSSGLSFAGHGRAVRQPNGTYLMVFSGNFIGENDREPSDVIRAVSVDGRTWTVVDRHLFPRGHDPALVQLADGTVAVVFAHLKDSLQVSTSPDGASWSEPARLVLLDETGGPVPEIHGDVCLARMPDGSLRMYSNGTHGITSFVPVDTPRGGAMTP